MAKILLDYEKTGAAGAWSSKTGACTVKVFDDYTCIVNGNKYDNPRTPYDIHFHRFNEHRGHDDFNVCNMLTEYVMAFENQSG